MDDKAQKEKEAKEKAAEEAKAKEEIQSDDDSEDRKSEAEEKIKSIEADTERINKAIADNENAKARQKLGGVTEAGQAPVKEEETPAEYSKKVMSGDLNE